MVRRVTEEGRKEEKRKRKRAREREREREGEADFNRARRLEVAMREKGSEGDIRRVNGMAGKGGGPEELNGSEVSPKEGVAVVTLGDSRGSGRNRGKSELSRVVEDRSGRDKTWTDRPDVVVAATTAVGG
jgi:hypothetical protein